MSGSPRITSSACSRAISRATGQKITFTTVQHVDDPQAWRAVLDFAVDANASGARLFPQVASRPVGILGGLACYHPFMRRPSYRALAHLPVAAQAERMRDPEVKARILAETDGAPDNAGSMEMFAEVMQVVAEFLFGLDEIVDYEPGPERSFGAIAAARGIPAIEALYDFLVQGDGTAVINLPGAGYMEGNLDAVREMIVHPTTIVGLADAGAHVKLICDGSSPSTQLTLGRATARRARRSRWSSWSSSRRGAPRACTASTTAARSKSASGPTST